MAGEKKQGGWFSRFKKDKPAESPSAGTDSKQPATASPKPVSPAKPVPKAKPVAPTSKTTPAVKPAIPAAKPVPAAKKAAKPAPPPRQTSSEKKAANLINPVRMEPIDTGLKDIYR